MGMSVFLVVRADSSSSFGVVRRSGGGELTHVNGGMIWRKGVRVEEAARFEKVEGKKKPADFMTKAITALVL